jgi:hypothetical protein
MCVQSGFKPICVQFVFNFVFDFCFKKLRSLTQQQLLAQKAAWVTLFRVKHKGSSKAQLGISPNQHIPHWRTACSTHDYAFPGALEICAIPLVLLGGIFLGRVHPTATDTQTQWLGQFRWAKAVGKKLLGGWNGHGNLRDARRCSFGELLVPPWPAELPAEINAG